MADRQLDILATRADWFTLPKTLPGRLNGDDFVFFTFPENKDFDPSRYTVVVEVLDNSGSSPYRSISKLRKSVELPHVKYGPHVLIAVVPDNDSLPSFEAELIRGSTYVIPSLGRRNGTFEMIRHGMHRPNGI